MTTEITPKHYIWTYLMKPYIFRIIYLLLALSFGAFIVGVVMLMKDRPSDAGPSDASPASITTIPQGTSQIVLKETWMFLKDLFVEPGTVLMPDSPPWRAMVALLHDGTWQHTYALEQRYTLLYLHYLYESTIADNVKTHECTWTGVVCDEQQRVVELAFPRSNIRGSLPADLVRLQYLTRLNVALKAITSIQVVEKMKQLTHIVADGNLITSLPEALPPRLEVLVLASNQLQKLPATIASITTLKQLELQANEDLQEDYTDILQLPDLQILDVSKTNLRATLDDSQQYLPSVQKFIASQSRLNLVLSNNMGRWTDLRHLDVGYSRGALGVTESLGAYVGSWTKLTSLSMQGTKMDSTIPTELGLLTNLERFDFFINPGLHGSLPTELGRLTAMNYFRVDNTAVSGPIPSEISNWETLVFGFFKAHGLTGELNLCSPTIMNLESICKGGGLSCSSCGEPKVSCPCCTICSSP